MLYFACGFLLLVIITLLGFCRQCARDAIRHGERADHYQRIADKRVTRQREVERAYNDLKSRAYLRDARGRMARASDVLK